jgi:hypothetical protein
MKTRIHQFSPEQINTLRASYGAIKTVSIDALPKLRAIFDGCEDAALKQLATAKINFVSGLAVNACVRRGLR